MNLSTVNLRRSVYFIDDLVTKRGTEVMPGLKICVYDFEENNLLESKSRDITDIGISFSIIYDAI